MNVNMNFLQELLSSIERRTRERFRSTGGDSNDKKASLAQLASSCETLM